MAKGITSHQLREIFFSEMKRDVKGKVHQTLFLSLISIIMTTFFDAINNPEKNSEMDENNAID